MEFFTEDGLTWRRLGPTLAGAVFGTAWWIWVDAVVCNKETVDFVHYIPGKGMGLCASRPRPLAWPPRAQHVTWLTG